MPSLIPIFKVPGKLRLSCLSKSAVPSLSHRAVPRRPNRLPQISELAKPCSSWDRHELFISCPFQDRLRAFYIQPTGFPEWTMYHPEQTYLQKADTPPRYKQWKTPQICTKGLSFCLWNLHCLPRDFSFCNSLCCLLSNLAFLIDAFATLSLG